MDVRRPPEELGWNAHFDQVWDALDRPGHPGRVARLDRGWSTVLHAREVEHLDDQDGADGSPGSDQVERVRNVGIDVAVGDWVITDGERIEHVLARRSAFIRRASFEGMRAESDTLAANIDVVFLVHSAGSPANQRRLERELVLSYDSGAEPVVVLTKADLAADIDVPRAALAEIAHDVPMHVVSGATGMGVDALAKLLKPNLTGAFLGASGTGKSTLINALLGADVQEVSTVRAGDQRGRHTTVAAELIPMPGGAGWLIDTPGMRAVSLWLSATGIERTFADVFDLMDRCRFRDCKHDQEPGCEVRAAIERCDLDPARLASLEQLVAEEAAIEDEQRQRERAADRRRRPRG